MKKTRVQFTFSSYLRVRQFRLKGGFVGDVDYIEVVDEKQESILVFKDGRRGKPLIWPSGEQRYKLSSCLRMVASGDWEELSGLPMSEFKDKDYSAYQMIQGRIELIGNLGTLIAVYYPS